jgi:hypothetical protein
MVLEHSFQGKSFFFMQLVNFLFFCVALCKLMNQGNKLQLIILVLQIRKCKQRKKELGYAP